MEQAEKDSVERTWQKNINRSFEAAGISSRVAWSAKFDAWHLYDGDGDDMGAIYPRQMRVLHEVAAGLDYQRRRGDDAQAAAEDGEAGREAAAKSFASKHVPAFEVMRKKWEELHVLDMLSKGLTPEQDAQSFFMNPTRAISAMMAITSLAYEIFKNGHPTQPMGEAEALAREVGALVDRKDAAYGQSFDRSVDFLRLLWPGDIPADRVELVPFFVAIFNKAGRLATAPDAFGEDALADLLGYVILFVRRQRRAARARQAAADAARAREGTFVQVLMPSGAQAGQAVAAKGSGQAAVGTIISGDSQPWAGPGPGK